MFASKRGSKICAHQIYHIACQGEVPQYHDQADGGRTALRVFGIDFLPVVLMMNYSELAGHS
jgi:hypothetical protein